MSAFFSATLPKTNAVAEGEYMSEKCPFSSCSISSETDNDHTGVCRYLAVLSREAPSLLNEESLKAWTGIKSRDGLLRWLRQHGIAFFLAKGRPCTTLEAVNRVLLQDFGRQKIEFA